MYGSKICNEVVVSLHYLRTIVHCKLFRQLRFLFSAAFLSDLQVDGILNLSKLDSFTTFLLICSSILLSNTKLFTIEIQVYFSSLSVTTGL
jgi:hypothetical protein